MLRNAENLLYTSIGKFSTICPPVPDFDERHVDTLQATQCTAFLCSNREFTWFIESWDVNRNDGDLVIENKKVYPAKVQGLNLASPLPFDFQTPSLVENISWRDGLIGETGPSGIGYRPGFGQYILSDTSRPVFQQLNPQTDLLGTGSNPAYTSLYRSSFSKQLGRLMSMAFYVDPELAAKYDASKSKKKKKSPNEQDYQQLPEYPEYTTYQGDGDGYGGGYGY